MSSAVSLQTDAIVTAVYNNVKGDTLERAAARYLVDLVSIGAMAFQYWDILITLDEEVKVVWPKPWSFLKFVYFFIRYFPACLQASILAIGNSDYTPGFNFTPHDCYIWQVYQSVSTCLFFVAVDYVLLLRVYALYSTHRILKIVIATLFILDIITMSVSLGFAAPKIKSDSLCLTISSPTALFVYGASSISFQFFLFVLTLIKFIISVKQGWSNTPLISLLMRDGTWSFFVILVILLGYSGVILTADSANAGLLYSWLVTIFSFVGYRNLLNIFDLSEPTRTRNSSTWTTTRSFDFTTHIFTTNLGSVPHYISSDEHEMTEFSSSSGRDSRRV